VSDVTVEGGEEEVPGNVRGAEGARVVEGGKEAPDSLVLKCWVL